MVPMARIAIAVDMVMNLFSILSSFSFLSFLLFQFSYAIRHFFKLWCFSGRGNVFLPSLTMSLGLKGRLFPT